MSTYYDSAGQQHSRQADRVFFIFGYSPSFGTEVRAIARSASFEQFGHFMMGTIRVGRRSITVTGGEDLDLDRYFDGWWPRDSCKVEGAAYDAWNYDRLKSSASLRAVGREFPALATCLREARKRPRKIAERFPPQRSIP